MSFDNFTDERNRMCVRERDFRRKKPIYGEMWKRWYDVAGRREKIRPNLRTYTKMGKKYIVRIDFSTKSLFSSEKLTDPRVCGADLVFFRLDEGVSRNRHFTRFGSRPCALPYGSFGGKPEWKFRLKMHSD